MKTPYYRKVKKAEQTPMFSKKADWIALAIGLFLGIIIFETVILLV